MHRRYSNCRALIEKKIQALIDLHQIAQEDPGTIGKALDTMKSIVQNLKKAGFNCEEGVPFIPFLLTRKMDVLTRRKFDIRIPKKFEVSHNARRFGPVPGEPIHNNVSWKRRDEWIVESSQF